MRLSLMFALACAAATPAPARQAAAVAIGEPGRQLHGTLLTPTQGAAGAEPVLILAGSGPTDRDGNSPLGLAASSYRLLAEDLAGRGIASLRVDKRGVAASAAAAPPASERRIQLFADDARLWAAELRRRTGARCVWLLGHSEGGLHALLSAQGNRDVCGLVLVAPIATRTSDLLRAQIRAAAGNGPVLDEALRIIAELEAGRTVPDDGMHPGLAPLFQSATQPLLMSMFAVDPAALITAYRGPVLVVQGTHDLQTPVADARALAAARPGIELRLFDGMNHVLKIAPEERTANLATYANADLPLAPGLAAAVADFVIAR